MGAVAFAELLKEMEEMKQMQLECQRSFAEASFQIQIQQREEHVPVTADVERGLEEIQGRLSQSGAKEVGRKC